MTTSPSRYRQTIRRALAWMLPASLYITRGRRSDGRICLTFDDGPHPEYTPRLLDVLAELHVPATFFVTGQAAEAQPDLVRRMVAEGHDVGHHSYTHGEPAATSAAELGREMDRTIHLLSSMGVPARLFRPPRGKVTVGKALRIWARRQTIVLWSSDPKDFACPSPSQVSDWFLRHPVRDGDIVLMHDTHPYAAAVLPDFAARTRGRGLSFGKVSEWCAGSARRAAGVSGSGA